MSTSTKRRLTALSLCAAVVAPFAMGASAAAPAAPPVVHFTWADPEISESSGLVAYHNRFVTVNDSGDVGRTFAVDGSTGQTVGGTSWATKPVDVEAVARTPAANLVIGDIGDNTASRSSVQILEVPMRDGYREVTPKVYDFTYPGGSRDAETLMVHPKTGRLFVVSKSFFGGVFYSAPTTLSTTSSNRFTAWANVLPIVTDGAFFLDGKSFVLRDYSQAVFYSYPEIKEIGRMDLPSQPQGEGIAVGTDNNLYVSSEGRNTPVYRVPMPAEIKAVVTPEKTSSAGLKG